jgi:hypothetical protein
MFKHILKLLLNRRKTMVESKELAKPVETKETKRHETIENMLTNAVFIDAEVHLTYENGEVRTLKFNEGNLADRMRMLKRFIEKVSFV